jgi:hypothetical protein
MAYPIEVKRPPASVYFTPAQSNAYYATRYSREGITIHWWGDGTGASNHDNIVNFFLRRTDGSVNYVLSDNKITEMVAPDNVAWTSQAGNPTTISIEHQPTLGAEGYKKSGWLVCELEKKYGRTLTLYPHKHWTATACPGTIDLNRIRQEANKWKSGTYGNVISTPSAGGSQVFNTDAEVQEAYLLLRGNPGTAAERAGWIGQAKQRFFVVAKPEADSVRKQLADVKAALTNLQNQPAKEVIKIVEKIVEKPVEVIKIQEVIKEVPAQVDEKAVVTNWFKKIWNSLFQKG